MRVEQALKLTQMQYQNTGGGDDPAWIEFLATMARRSNTDPEEYWLPMLAGLTRGFGRWVYANTRHQEVVVVYDVLQPFGTGLSRRVGVHTFHGLRQIQREIAA